MRVKVLLLPNCAKAQIIFKKKCFNLVMLHFLFQSKWVLLKFRKPYAPIIRQWWNHHHLRKENNNSRCTTVNDNYHKNSYQKVPFVSPTNRANSQSSSFVVGRKTAAKNPFPQSLAARKYVRLTDTKFNNNKFKTKVEVIVGDTKGGSFDNRKEDDIKVKSKSSNSKVNIKWNNSGKITVDKNHSYLERSRIPFKAIENKMNSYKPKNSM